MEEGPEPLRVHRALPRGRRSSRSRTPRSRGRAPRAAPASSRASAPLPRNRSARCRGSPRGSSTRPRQALTIRAPGSGCSSIAVSRSTSSSLTRSVLLSTSTFANSICSTSRSATVRSSSPSSAASRARRSSALVQSARNRCASTTVTSVSSRATSERRLPVAGSSKVNVSATGSGSEMPGRLDQQVVEAPLGRQAGHLDQEILPERAADAAVRHLDEPLLHARCSAAPRPRTSAASTLTSLMSLTITATRSESRFARTLVQQRGLAGAQEAGQHGHRKLFASRRGSSLASAGALQRMRVRLAARAACGERGASRPRRDRPGPGLACAPRFTAT